MIQTENEQILAEFRLRRKLFDDYLKKYDLNKFTCPSCGYPTLDERNSYDICDICNWEDDGQDDPKADEIWGGANYKLSLTDSRLKITNDLEKLAIKLNGSVLKDPNKFFSILNSHTKRMHPIHTKMEGEINDSHPLWNEYHTTAALIKSDLIEKA